jgi:Phosphoesterase family
MSMFSLGSRSNTGPRHAFLAPGAKVRLLVAAIGFALFVATTADAASPIKHVIIIMQENRSFDHYFGTFPGANGIPAGVCLPLDPANPGAGCVQPFHDERDGNAGGPHYPLWATYDLDDGVTTAKMDGFVYAQTRESNTVLRQCSVTITASQEGATLTVTQVPSGYSLAVGTAVSGKVSPETIVSFGSGSGGAGTYTMSVSQSRRTEELYASLASPPARCYTLMEGMSRHDVAGYHTDKELPNYWTYARNFVLQDAMFEGERSWSRPAHLDLTSEWSASCTDDTNASTCHSDIDLFTPDYKTITYPCRVGGDVAIPTPHSPGRADFPHPVLHERDSLAAA